MVGILIPTSKSKVSNATIPSSGGDGIGGSSSSRNGADCCGLSKLVTKLIAAKRRSGIKRSRNRSRQSSSFKCRYDPSSYSLNFDSSGNNSISSEDDYYYQFCAFSSRFASCTVPRTTVSPPSLNLTTTVAFSR